MTRYSFALSSGNIVREVGHVTSPSFDDALVSIGRELEPFEGDTLEIGVRGFPPARYECVLSMEEGRIGWRAAA